MDKVNPMKGKKNPNAGRKLFDGKNRDIVIAKLEEAAAIDASVDEMCFYADISRDSFYRYWNAHPEFRHRIEQLRNKPVLLARQEFIKGITGNPEIAIKYLERKKKDEFSPKSEVDLNIKTIKELLDEAEKND